MRPITFILILFFVTFTYFSNAENPTPTEIHPLRRNLGSGNAISGLNCLSWRLAVETNNLQNWKTVPEQCEGYIGHYMMGAQYRKDCLAVTMLAYDYVKSLKLKKDGKNVWVFDVDETTLSNIPYFANPSIGFGAHPYNATAFNAWVAEAKAPAIPSVLSFYTKVVRLGFKIVFITTTNAAYTEQRKLNLNNVGYHTWDLLILKGGNDSGLSSMEYKAKHRTELENKGYRIIGNMGDQWTDLLGPHPGLKTFKLPDPIYYVA